MSRTVLLIEDNELNRYLTTFLLEKYGYIVIFAPDGFKGLDLARDSAPDLVLLDMQLPGMDGYAVARALRAIPLLHDIPIIAVTSYAMLGDRDKALKAGCTGYIEKPIDPETFVSEMERIGFPHTPPSSHGLDLDHR